jgi:predicted GNAT family acetyltransferase
MTEPVANPVIDVASRRRYELTEDGFTAFADYQRFGDGVIVIPHVEAPMELRGGGAAGRLMAGIAAHARAEGFRIVPSCPYAAAWFKRHPDQADLLA